MRVQALCGNLQATKYKRVFSRKKRDNKLTLYARSFAVKIPLSPSSSSTTKTQSVRLAAQS